MALMLDEEMDENVTTIKVIGVGGGVTSHQGVRSLRTRREHDACGSRAVLQGPHGIVQGPHLLRGR